MASFILFSYLIHSSFSQQEPEYNIEQAISDNAQLNTLSFDCLSFITGNTCADSFIPPGKVADYFGFQHLRDNTDNGMGHNTDFLTFCAFNVISILNEYQLSLIATYAATEVALVHQYAYLRFPLLVAFRRHLENNYSTDLSQYEVAQFSADPLYTLDTNITITRAYVFSKVIKSLNATQRAFLDDMVAGGFASWPTIYDTDRIDRDTMKGDTKQQIMTYASELFAWYLGDIESDTYFAPERQANYFGSFFFKDAPAVGTANYTIDEKLTADKGSYMREYVLNKTQGEWLETLVSVQKNDLLGMVESRRNISRELRLYLETGYDSINDIDIDFVYQEAKKYGEHDGNISYYYTMAFRRIYDTLNSSQWAAMHLLRDLDDYPCEPQYIYLYSKQIDRPVIENTDFLFLPSTTNEPIDTTIYEGPTCDEIINVNKGWKNKLSWNESAEADGYIEKGRQKIIKKYPHCGNATETEPELEFWYRLFYKSSKLKLKLKMHVCCGYGGRFGSAYTMPTDIAQYSKYEPNEAWYYHNTEASALDIVTINDESSTSKTTEIKQYFVYGAIGLIIIGCIAGIIYVAKLRKTHKKPAAKHNAQVASATIELRVMSSTANGAIEEDDEDETSPINSRKSSFEGI